MNWLGKNRKTMRTNKIFLFNLLSVLFPTYISAAGLASGLKFIKTAPENPVENPVLWTGMKGASGESRNNKSDAETSSA
jgi:hypothetical protein